MARSSRNRKHQNYQKGGRDTHDISRRSLPLSQKYKTTPVSNLQAYEDRRRWHPELAERPQITLSQVPARYRVKSVTYKQKHPQISRAQSYSELAFQQPSFRIGYINPDRVLLCVRRQVRREVLHAKQIAGGRGLGRDGVRFTPFSQFGC